MSSVWNFFKVCDTDVSHATCNTCKRLIPRGGKKPSSFNTTNLIRHLKLFHSEAHVDFLKQTAEAEKKKKETATTPTVLLQRTIDDTKCYNRHSEKAMGISRKVMEFICLDDQPFSAVEGKGFQRLVAHLDPRYLLPGRQWFADKSLTALHEDVRAHVANQIKNVPSISFTSDIWSSDVSPMSFLSLTAQWIDADFERHNVILHTQECPGSHTAVNLATWFVNMLRSWEIENKRVHVMLRDNARNMAKAMEDAGFSSLPCFAHTLQLAINDAVLSQRTVKDILAMGRRIVGHFKHSPLAYSQLWAIQGKLNQPEKRLQQDVATRWNSTYYMLESLLEQKHALGAYVVSYELPATFTAYQWALIENLLSLLKPFEELTKDISSSSSSAADVIPSVMALKLFLETPAASDHGVQTTKSTLLETVSARFAHIENERLYTLATILDPRFKDRCFSEELKTKTRRQLLDLLTSQAVPGPAPSPRPSAAHNTGEPATKVPRPGSLSSMFDKIMAEAPQPQGDITAGTQVNLYLSEPPIPRKANLLEYWKGAKTRFPVLAPVARAYLSAPSTSVDSERLFSAAANILTEHRNRLSADKTEKLLFIKKNLPTMIQVRQSGPSASDSEA